MSLFADHPGQDIVSTAWLRTHGIRLGVVVAIALIVLTLVGVAVRRMERRILAGEHKQRAVTIAHVVSSAARIAVLTIAGLLVLGELDLDLAPLIAGAGVAGVAIGFGAQSLVRDFFTGFFLLLEDQLAVGDSVEIRTSGGSVSGTVEQMTLRATWVRGYDGTLHVVPNGNIQLVSKQARGWARAIVDVRVPSGTKLEDLRARLEPLLAELARPGALDGALLSPPKALGLESAGPDELVYRVVAETRPSARGEVERELRRMILERMGARE